MRIGTRSGTEMGVKRKVGTGVGIGVEKNEGTEVETGVEIGIEDEVEVRIEIVGWIGEVGPETDHVTETDQEIGTGGTDLIEVEGMIEGVEIDLVGSGLRVEEVMIRRKEVKMRIRRRRETRRKRRRCSQENPNQVWFLKLLSQLQLLNEFSTRLFNIELDSLHDANDKIDKFPISRLLIINYFQRRIH